MSKIKLVRTEQNPAGEFPSDEYNKMLDLILKSAQDEYKQITYDLPAHQKAILRNYQWLSTVILAAECTLFSYVLNNGQGFWMFPWNVSATAFFYGWAAAAVFCCVTVFILGLDTLRGRGVFGFPSQHSYTELMTYAYDEARKKDPLGTLRCTMIKDLETVIHYHRETAKPVGPKLRKLSWGLLLSLLFTAFALLPNIQFANN